VPTLLSPRRPARPPRFREGLLLSLHPFRLPAALLPATLALLLAAAAPQTAHARADARAKSVQQKGVPADTTTRRALIIEGDDHLFMVAAPKGWVLDDTAGMGSRIRCVFYTKGEKWTTAQTVMYVNPLHGYGVKARTLSALIEEDEKSFRKRAPKGAVIDAGTLPTGARGKIARVRYFSPNGRAPAEAVAYVPEKELVMLVVLSAKSPGGFQGALDAYRELVSSYAYVGSNREFGR